MTSPPRNAVAFLALALLQILADPTASLSLGGGGGGGNHSNVTIEKNTFESDLDGWETGKEGQTGGGWIRKSVSDVRLLHPAFPHPPDGSSEMVLVPSAGGGMSLMHKSLSVPPDTNLEIFFTCVVLGWRRDNDPSVRMRNPVLQVLYDDVLVFHLETAITENTGHYSNGRWNQFRLFSSYKTNFTMRATVMGSSGEGPGKMVAVDNFVIKMITNNTEGNVTKFEPEADLREKDGRWEEIRTKSEEAEDKAIKNPRKAAGNPAPEFCQLLAERGPCLGAWPRYYYNPLTNSCERFVYGGCDGNENNFHVKLACEAICKRPNATEEGQILTSEKNGTYNLTLHFDNGFGDWNQQYWRVLRYDSSIARVLNITALNSSSTAGGSPVYKQNTIFRRPRLVHPLDLLRRGNMSIGFSLKLIGSLNPALHPFFEHMNPGFKIYIGDDLMFDYSTSGSADDKWHTYNLTTETESILQFPHLTNDGGTRQVLRIEAWQGSGERGYIVLDDLRITQVEIPPPPASTPSSSPTAPSTSRSRAPTTAGHPPNTRSTKSSSRSTPAATKAAKSSSTTAASTKSSATTSVQSTSTNSTTPIKRLILFPCNLPRTPGPCKMMLTRYFYDSSSGSCRTFSYGGCKGNANNFQTEGDCKKKCMTSSVTITPSSSSPSSPDICALREQPGNCHTYMERYYFNVNKKKCSIFIYSGCGGNGNNFESKADCQHVCAHHMDFSESNLRPFVTSIPRTLADCRRPVSPGDCHGRVNMFAFDSRRGRCASFTYSGCGGNENLFFTMSECRKTCGTLTTPAKNKRKQRKPILKAVCNLPQASAPCAVNETTKPHWFYSKSKSACLEEQSCRVRPRAPGRSVNQFDTEAACKATCNVSSSSSSSNNNNSSTPKTTPPPSNASTVSSSSPGSAIFPAVPPFISSVEFELRDCLLTPRAGACKDTFSRFYYDPEQRECLEFRYTGCRGNKNNFMTHRECISTCMDAEKRVANKNVTICEEPKQVGPCKHSLKRYFFNSKAERCEEFEYGGCKGNRNRFLSLSLCQSTCETALVEKRVDEDERAGASAASVAETVLGVILCLLAVAAVALGVKYYKVRQAKENYRIFTNERRRAGSVVSSGSGATLPHASVGMAYDNPVYAGGGGGGGGDGDQQQERDREVYDAADAIQLNGTSFGGSNV